MAAKSALLGSSLMKKYWMALTGLFLCLFLVIHLVGNLSLFDLSAEGKIGFNEYTEFMTSFMPIKVVSYLLYFSILFHAFDGILVLATENKKARPHAYAYSKPERNSIWASRNMGVLGTAILVFIVLHMYAFWFKYKFTALPMDEAGFIDMHGVVIEAFRQGWYVALYVVSMILLAFHLWHGFASAFQTLGLRHPRYTPVIALVGKIYSVMVPAAFAAIPLYLYFN